MITNKSVAVVLAAAILASGGGIASSVVTAAPAHAASTQTEVNAAVQQILNDTNAERAKMGLAPLTLSAGMSKVSQDWTQKMAVEGYGHNPSYSRQLPRGLDGASSENVAMGHKANEVVPLGWMKSTTGHRENLLGSWTHIGIGYWVDDNGMTFFTQNFARYNLNLTAPHQPGNTVSTREFTSGWYGTTKESITDYKAELYSSTGALLETKFVTTGTDSNPYYRVTFTGLNPKTTYTVKTTARNTTVMSTVVSSPTRTHQVTTLEEFTPPSAPNAPTGLIASNTFHNETVLNWVTPTGVVGTITGYNVTVKQAGQPDRQFSTVENSLKVTELTENTDYTVQVTANVLGADNKTTVISPAASISVKTAIYHPVSVDTPTNFNVAGITHDSAALSWVAPTGTVGRIVDYTVTVRSAAGTKSYTTPATSYRITGLIASTGYTVSVKANAVSVDGLNRASSVESVALFNTAAIPSPVVKVAAPVVTASRVAYNGFTVSWPQPAVTGRITGYRVTVKLGTRVLQTHNLTAATRTKAVTGLVENTGYTVIVEAMAVAPNGINRATAPTTKTVRTGFTAASTVRVAAPAYLTATASRTAVTATWRQPAVTGRVVNYTVTIKEGTRVVRTVVITGGKYSFTGLKANTVYGVYVTANAVSANGKYRASATASKAVRTLR